MVFGNNTASDTSKLSKIPRAAKWYFENFENLRARIIAKYYVQESCYYLFIIEAKKFSVTHKIPFFLRLKKTNKSVYVRNNLFASMEERIDGSFCETSTNHSRQPTWNSSMEVNYKSRLLRSPQRWYDNATLLYHRFLLLYHYYAEIVMF